MAGQGSWQSETRTATLAAVAVVVVVVLGFTLYFEANSQARFVLEKGVPAGFDEIRLLPTVLHQKPYYAFTVYNLGGGFNSTVEQVDKSVVALFPSLKGSQDPDVAFVISNITLEYSTLGVVIVKPPSIDQALSYANRTLFGSICQYYLANPQEVYCGHLDGTPYMVYYMAVSPAGTTEYSYTVLAWSETKIVVLQYLSPINVSVLQLKEMAEMLLEQDL